MNAKLPLQLVRVHGKGNLGVAVAHGGFGRDRILVLTLVRETQTKSKLAAARGKILHDTAANLTLGQLVELVDKQREKSSASLVGDQCGCRQHSGISQ